MKRKKKLKEADKKWEEACDELNEVERQKRSFVIKMEKEFKTLSKKLMTMTDFYEKLNANFKRVELTMEGEVLVLRVYPKK